MLPAEPADYHHRWFTARPHRLQSLVMSASLSDADPLETLDSWPFGDSAAPAELAGDTADDEVDDDSIIDDSFPGLPRGYDLSKETYINHRASWDEQGEFFGPFRDIRKTRDHAYHGYYSRARQEWQDTILQLVVKRTTPQPIPWLVFTCGAMGVGKGYTLRWMSNEGIVPLDNVVHLDPDKFKYTMPEWPAYVDYGRKKGDRDIPGSSCHRESCYMQEIALEESMRLSQNIVVDGSLRNAEWFVSVFKDIRRRFPQYKIAIFQITAPEAVIRSRLEARAKRTGRAIPEKVFMDSIDAVSRSVACLAPHADFMARIDNSEIPRLEYFSSIDRSGRWSAIQSRFARTLPGLEDFPKALAPLFLSRVDDATLRFDTESFKSVARGQRKGQWGTLHVGGSEFKVMVSPAAACVMRGEASSSALVPNTSVSFVWIYPAIVGPLSEIGEQLPLLGEAEANLLTVGGFAHFDAEDRLLAINAATLTRPQVRPSLLQFGNQIMLTKAEADDIPASRWAPVTAQHMQAVGARRFAFLAPAEKVAGHHVCASGGFVFELHPMGSRDTSGLQYMFFPFHTNWAEAEV